MLIVCACLALVLGCKSSGSTAAKPAAEPPFMSAVAGTPPVQAGQEAPSADKTGGFDGKRAYEQVAKQVSYGPRPAGSPALAKLQDYLEAELKSYGCTAETDSFSADTPAGRLPMKNFLVKIPGEKPGIILLGTHYDTKRLDNFVGADDAGSSTGVMMELARLFCKQPPQKYAVWIAFFDGEEAVNPQWKDPDNRYGSRQMAAKLAASGDLKNVRAFILADLVGANNLLVKPEENSTKSLNELVWKIAAQLGYQNIFVNEQILGVSDDHLSFLSRKVPSVDLINLNTSTGYWHTPQDTMDKISPKSLAIVGNVILETIKQLQQQ
jgi:Zn-dependent M28 family amino/carboxypeptidase